MSVSEAAGSKRKSSAMEENPMSPIQLMSSSDESLPEEDGLAQVLSDQGCVYFHCGKLVAEYYRQHKGNKTYDDQELLFNNILALCTSAFPNGNVPSFLNREVPGCEEPLNNSLSDPDSFIANFYNSKFTVAKTDLEMKVSGSNLLLKRPLICFRNYHCQSAPKDSQIMHYLIPANNNISCEAPPATALLPGDTAKRSVFDGTTGWINTNMDRGDTEMSQRVLIYRHERQGHVQSMAAIQREGKQKLLLDRNSSGHGLTEAARRVGNTGSVYHYLMCPVPPCVHCIISKEVPIRYGGLSGKHVVDYLKQFGHCCTPLIPELAFREACHANEMLDCDSRLQSSETSSFVAIEGGQVCTDLTPLELELYQIHKDKGHWPMSLLANQDERFAECRPIRCNCCIRGFIAVREYALCSKHPNGFVTKDDAHNLPSHYLDAAPIPESCRCDEFEESDGKYENKFLEVSQLRSMAKEAMLRCIQVHVDLQVLNCKFESYVKLYDRSEVLRADENVNDSEVARSVSDAEKENPKSEYEDAYLKIKQRGLDANPQIRIPRRLPAFRNFAADLARQEGTV